MNNNPDRVNHGQSMVELALLLPILLLISFIVLDLGRGIYYYSAVYNAAWEGARYGIVQPDDYSGINAAARELAVGLDQSDLCVDTFLSGTNNNTISVEVEYIFTLVTPLANLIPASGTECCTDSSLGEGQFCLRNKSSMSVER